jgi:cysteine desulfurase
MALLVMRLRCPDRVGNVQASLLRSAVQFSIDCLRGTGIPTEGEGFAICPEKRLRQSQPNPINPLRGTRKAHNPIRHILHIIQIGRNLLIIQTLNPPTDVQALPLENALDVLPAFMYVYADGTRRLMELPTLIYLDNNASTPLSPPVIAAISKAMKELGGNPSSIHSSGRSVRRAIENVRENLASWLHVDPEKVYFTSGATEANNIVLHSVTNGRLTSGILTTAIEHPSILNTIDATSDVKYVDIQSNGIVDLNDLHKKLLRNPYMLSIQWVNNETGIAQPIEKIRDMCADAGVLFHIDAAQAVGKLPVDLIELDPDFFTFSGHKFHAPAGIGVLICKDPHTLKPLIWGGGQEQGLRSGTENWLGIIGIGAAIADRSENFETHTKHMRELRDQFESKLTYSMDWIKIIGHKSPRVPNTSNIMFTGIDGQALVAQLNGLEVCCSQTSACSNQRPEPSHVLKAMGLSESEAYSCVRFSFSPMNTTEEINQTVDSIQNCVNRLLTFCGGLR